MYYNIKSKELKTKQNSEKADNVPWEFDCIASNGNANFVTCGVNLPFNECIN